MGTATVNFQAGSYQTNHALINAFNQLVNVITGPIYKTAEVIQRPSDVNDPNFPALTLHSQNGFSIKVCGLHCGREGEAIVDLLKFCGFELDDITIHAILNCDEMKVTIWNRKMMN